MTTRTLHLRRLVSGILLAFLPAAASLRAEPRDDNSPWGIGADPGDPLLPATGAKWTRAFDEWQHVEPRRNVFNWERTDKIVAGARANNIRILGWWWYFSPFASADGGTRRGPIKDIEYFREYVAATVGRYKEDIKYWEVWNEFNGSFYDGRQGADRVRDYADLVVAAYDTAKKADPGAKIGMSVANFDVNFLNDAIKAGAAGHFDFICVHPYENLGAVREGGEVGYLSLAQNLRDMLKANGQDVNTPLWITEIGWQAPRQPDAAKDALQADMIVKAFVLSIAQGFQRIVSFGFRPWADAGGDFGLVRPDGSLRPSYTAFQTMTTLLGPEPKYVGWLDLGPGAYGFLFQGEKGGVLAAWSPPGRTTKTSFTGDVTVTDLAGQTTTIAAGRELALTNRPVFLSGLPANLAAQAQANLGKPYPWGGDYSKVAQVTCKLGALNADSGLVQIKPETTSVVNYLTDTCRRSNVSKGGEGFYAYFRVDPAFVPFGTKDLEVTFVAKRADPNKETSFDLNYESLSGYKSSGKRWTVPAGDGWSEQTWKLNDANFVGQWGWNFRSDAGGAGADFLIKEVRVRKAGAGSAR